MRGISKVSRPGRAVFLPALLATTALTGMAVPAVAQETSSGIEMVTVTAQKREQNLQSVPVSVQVLGETRLQELHVVSADDYIKYLPSVASQAIAPGFTVVHMRGVASGENNNHSGPLPTVGTYLDEQPITTIYGILDLPIIDVARIEALAGPQGTLYGASSEAGTIRIITNKPSVEGFEASWTAEINTVAHGDVGYLVHGMVNVPLHDKLAIRIVGWHEHTAGYIDNVPGSRTFTNNPCADDPDICAVADVSDDITINNASYVEDDFNDGDKLGGRATLMALLNNDWTATVSIMGQTQENGGIYAFSRGFGEQPGIQPGFIIGPSHLGELEVQRFNDDSSKDRWWQTAFTVQGKVGNLDLTYTAAYMDRRLKTSTDYADYTYWYDVLYGYGVYWYDDNGDPLVNPTQYILGKDHFTKQSHELRLSSPPDRRFRWIAGLFYQRQTHRIEQRYVIRDLADSISVNTWPDTLWLTLQDREDVDYAGFIEASYDIVPELTLTAGVRGYYFNNSLIGFFGFDDGYSSKTGISQCFAGEIVPNTPCTNLDDNVKDVGETHKLNLSWQATDDVMLYGTYSTGFRPGGVNRRSEFAPYSADFLDNFELGWKTTWADGRLRWNGAIFYQQWKDFQFSFLGPNSLTLIANAGDATVQGVEMDVLWIPVDGLTLAASGSYTDGELDEDYCGLFENGVVVTDCPGTAEAPAGTRLPVTPRWKATASARYEWPMGAWTGHVQGAMTYQSEVTPSLRLADNSVLGTQGSFTTADFTAGINGEGWMIEAFILNAFDERGELLRYTNCNTAVCGNQVFIVPNRPQTIGLRVGQKF
jgi:outer membrane receptor protein involved in Fe transport